MRRLIRTAVLVLMVWSATAQAAGYTFTVNTWGAKQRPWGFEVRVDVTWVETGRIFNETLNFPDKTAALNATTRNAAIAALKERIKQQIIMEQTQPPPMVCPNCGRPL